MTVTTYNGATKDKKSGKFASTGTPKDTVVLGIRIESELKDRVDRIPNKGEFLKELITKAVEDWEKSHEA